MQGWVLGLYRIAMTDGLWGCPGPQGGPCRSLSRRSAARPARAQRGVCGGAARPGGAWRGVSPCFSVCRVLSPCVAMVKLTAELIEQAAQYTNAVRDRELDLRGARAPRGRGAVLGAGGRLRAEGRVCVCVLRPGGGY